MQTPNPPKTSIRNYGVRGRPTVFIHNPDGHDEAWASFPTIDDAQRCARMIEEGTDPTEAAEKCGCEGKSAPPQGRPAKSGRRLKAAGVNCTMLFSARGTLETVLADDNPDDIATALGLIMATIYQAVPPDERAKAKAIVDHLEVMDANELIDADETPGDDESDEF